MQDPSVHDLSSLSDTELLFKTHALRLKAEEGSPAARSLAREYEDEMTRRFGGTTTLRASLDGEHDTLRPWWKFW
jgi:hypothetical protein